MFVESDSTFHTPSNQHPDKPYTTQQQLREQATDDYIKLQSGESTELLVITQAQQVGDFATLLCDQGGLCLAILTPSHASPLKTASVPNSGCMLRFIIKS